MIKWLAGAFLALLGGTLLLMTLTVNTSSTICGKNRAAQASGELPALEPLTDEQWNVARSITEYIRDSNPQLATIGVAAALYSSDLHLAKTIDGQEQAISPFTGSPAVVSIDKERVSFYMAVSGAAQYTDHPPAESVAWAIGKSGADLSAEYVQAALIVAVLTDIDPSQILDAAVTDPYCTYVQQPMGDVLTINGISYPVPGYTAISSRYGYRIHPITHERTLHSGIDFPAPCGTPIIPMRPGTVVYVNQREPGFGTLIEIQHEDGTQTWYGHMYPGSIYVREGDQVSEGQHIADVGSAGTSTGCHLHVELHLPSGKAVDPGPVFGWY